MTNQRPRTDRFFVKSTAALTSLQRWLVTHPFNSLYHGAKDSQGNQLIGLSWQHPGGLREDRGLVVVPAAELLAPTLALLQRCSAEAAPLGIENLYVTLPGTEQQSLAKRKAMLVCGPAGWLVVSTRPGETKVLGHSGDPSKPMRLELESLVLCDTLGATQDESDSDDNS